MSSPSPRGHHKDAVSDASIDVQPSPDRSSASAALSRVAHSPGRAADLFAWPAVDAAVGKSPSILKRRLSQSQLSNTHSATSSVHTPASPSSRRAVTSLNSLSSLSSTLHSRVLDALSSLHRQYHQHQSPPPADIGTSPTAAAATLTLVGSPLMLTRITSESAAEELASERERCEEIGCADEIGDMPVFINALQHQQQRLPAHFTSISAPHIQARFPSPSNKALRDTRDEADSDEDSTPLLVSSQPSSPAYTPSHTITTVKQQSQHTLFSSHFSSTPSTSSALAPSSTAFASSTHSLRSTSPTTSTSFSSYPDEYTVDKPPSYRRTAWCTALTVTIVGIAVVLFHFLWPRLVMYMTTGSVIYHDYAYYSAANAAQRLYPHFYSDDGQYNEAAIAALRDSTCPAPANHTNPMPVVDAAPSVDGVTHLHIVVGADAWTLFPWLWDSILVNHTWADGALTPTPPRCTSENGCHVCADAPPLSALCHKWFLSEGVAVHLVNFPIDERVLGDITTLLVVGQWWPRSVVYDWLQTDAIAPLLHPNFRLMTMLLMGEECNNWNGDWTGLREHVHPRLAATFTTYGDCHINPAYHQLRPIQLPNPLPIDMSQSVVYWPLGPSVEHGFPSRWLQEEEDGGSEERARELLLNLMVSITPEKSTRMQAWMVTTAYCEARGREGQRCYNHNNDLVWKVITHFDAYVGTSLHTALPIDNPTDTQYLPLLRNSTYTLCPAGKNPEQYRIWEALMVGSIPVIEDPAAHMGGEPAMHPAHGAGHRCTRWDVHRVLRKYGAPVLYVDDWRQLPEMLDAEDAQSVLDRRRELKRWFRDVKVELRREVFERVKYLNGRQHGS